MTVSEKSFLRFDIIIIKNINNNNERCGLNIFWRENFCAGVDEGAMGIGVGFADGISLLSQMSQKDFAMWKKIRIFADETIWEGIERDITDINI